VLTLAELMDTFKGVGNRAVAIANGVGALEKQLASLKTEAQALTVFATELGLAPKPGPRALPLVPPTTDKFPPPIPLATSELRLFNLLQTPDYTPGPKLAKTLGISKRSIQSRIYDLRQKGIQIDSINDPVQNRYGYKLSPDIVWIEPKKLAKKVEKVPAAKAKPTKRGSSAPRPRPRGIRRAIRIAAVEQAANAALDLFIKSGENFLSWRKVSKAIRPFLQDTHTHSYSMVTHIIAYLRRTNDIESARQARRRGVDIGSVVKGYRLVPESKQQVPEVSQEQQDELEEVPEIA
jgi:biotin operon repressor